MSQRTSHEPRLTIPVSDHDHSVGPANASVTLLEYGDFECPYCGAAYPLLKEIVARMGDDLRFVFRNFPISTSHPHAQKAAEAAEAAGAQGKFWEMHDELFEHQQELGAAALHRYAAKVGLHLERFDRELANDTYASRVHEDFLGGVRSGVNGTPTLYVNGARYDRELELETLAADLQQARHR